MKLQNFPFDSFDLLIQVCVCVCGWWWVGGGWWWWWWWWWCWWWWVGRRAGGWVGADRSAALLDASWGSLALRAHAPPAVTPAVLCCAPPPLLQIELQDTAAPDHPGLRLVPSSAGTTLVA